MRVYVRAICDNHERSFDIACGSGDKTFKWLSLAVAQLYADAPNGVLRHCDEYRGVSKNAQHFATKITLVDGTSPHPAAIISDFLRDQDTVTVTLINSLQVNKFGTPLPPNWASLAYSSSEDHYGVLYDEEDSKTFVAPNVAAVPEFTVIQESMVRFMRIIMRTQLFNEKQRGIDIEEAWTIAARMFPKISADEAVSIENLLFSEWHILSEAFKVYSPSGNMDVKEFTFMCSDLSIFPQRDNSVLAARAFHRVLKLASEFHDKSTLTMKLFVATLIVLAQIRHNDISEKGSTVLRASGYLRELLLNNFRSIAKERMYACLPKEVLSSSSFLLELRNVYDDLIAVFEKYAAKHNRDVYTSLPIDHVVELFHDVKLFESKDSKRAENLLRLVQSGAINGRDKDVQPPYPENEYLFPELIEAACRVQYEIDLTGSSGTKKRGVEAVQQTQPPQSVDIHKAYVTALKKLLTGLLNLDERVERKR